MKQFKIKMLQYVLGKINKAIATEYLKCKDFKIEAQIENVDYEGTWAKFQKGEIVVSELSNIIWKGISV